MSETEARRHAEIERHRTPILTELDRGEPAPELEAAAEEGLAYVPPIDPPTRADPEKPVGLEIAAGVAVSALSEPYLEDHESELLPDELDLTARIRDAPEADAATTDLADRLIVGTRGSTVVDG